jgi:pilus assembly protein CpaC
MRHLNTQLDTRRSRAKQLILAAVLCTSQMAWTPVARGADGASPDIFPPTSQPTEAPSMIAKGLDETGGGIGLIVGQSRLILLNGPVRAVDVTQPDVVQAKVVSPLDIVLTGHKAGSAELVLWDDHGRSQTVGITVAPDLRALRAELAKVLPNTHVEVTMANADIVVSGKVASAQIADQVAQLAAPYGAKVVNMMEVSGGQQVTLQVQFAEVSKSAIDSLGVNFGVAGGSGFGANVIGGVEPFGVVPGLAPGALALGVPSPGSNVTQFLGLTAGKTPFDIFIAAMEQNSLLRVLAEPNLTTLSGNQASFLAGGEIPIPVPQSGSGGGAPTITIEYKQFGIRLTFTPVVMGDGRIRLQVAPEVSELDFADAITLNGFSIPALTTRNASTTVELNEGQTLAMAGLLNNTVKATNTATPVLGSLPIIGALFRSVRYERDETELVVLITPRLAAGMNPSQVTEFPGEHWRYPNHAQLYLNADLGGPVADTAHAPATAAPARFQGTYGFVPATDPGIHGGK